MTVEAVCWVPRYGDGAPVKHKESGRVGIVQRFEHMGFYAGDRYIIIPTYLVAFAGYCEVHDGHPDRCQHYVSEDELESRPT